MQQSELRKDYIQEKYVIISPKRGKRPHQLKKKEVRIDGSETCVFCPKKVNRIKDLFTIGPKNNWRVKVILNKFPAVSLDNRKAYGTQEVVIETPNHIKELDELSISHIADLLKAYAARTREISKDKKIEYILIFKNQGGKAGASIIHSHSQIFATRFLPPHLFDKSQKTQEYKLRHGRCVYCDVIEREKTGPRLIWQDARVIAFCPWAPMHNYEVWIIPKRHLDNVTVLNSSERLSFARALKIILKKICRLGMDYNYYFHQVINDEDQHLYMKIKPRGSVWAGVEIGSGVVINPIAPEEAAKFYRGD